MHRMSQANRLLLSAILIAVFLLAFTLTAFTPVAPRVSEKNVSNVPVAVELLSNGDFSAGFDPWWGASINPVTTNGYLEAIILSGGSNPWDAAFGQHGVPVQTGGNYTVTLQAWASVPITVPVMLQENGGSYTQYFNAPLVLGTTAQTFTFYFTGPADDPAATFQVQMGGQGEPTLYFDNISVMGPAPAPPPPPTDANLIINGDFSNGIAPWWTSNISTTLPGSGLIAEILVSGSNPWDAGLGQKNIPIVNGNTYTLTLQASANTPITITALLQEDGGSYTTYFSTPLPLTTATQYFTFPFVAGYDDDEAAFAFHMGGQGLATISINNVALSGPPPVVEPPVLLPIVRLNQNGYLPLAPKRATISSSVTSPLTWTLYNRQGTVVLTGSTIITPVANGTTAFLGYDADSGDYVHLADFSAYQTEGTGYFLNVDGNLSHPFDISNNVYNKMKYDALAYFYHNRSGITLTMPYADDVQWTRPAGHIGVLPNLGDTDVPCFSGFDGDGVEWYGCNYTLDVTGGWYDAGDHGKYVVNGGISAWTMLNQYERTQYVVGADQSAFADGAMNIPENSNGVPDILDEARWEIEFLLAMQVPAGGTTRFPVSGTLNIPVGGMVHHKMHDGAWTGLGLAPHEDPQQRYLYPPSTAATLNMAAVAAQCARIWETIDPAFSAKCLTAAESAWQAALANPAIYAGTNFSNGGGPYNDDDVSDEFYWAAAELFVTTGEAQYHNYMLSSTHYLTVPAVLDEYPTSMTWGNTQALGSLSLALVPNNLSAAELDTVRQNVVKAADSFVTIQNGQGYLTPFTVNNSGEYPWGSNSFVLNNMVVMGAAYDLTTDATYLNGVSEAMDYILGRNPMDQSYVSGYGERPLQNPHHRFWAKQSNPAFPPPHPGAVSGGPNSGLEDPYAQTVLPGCAPQKCFVDHIESWSTNEITINWNAPFAWVLAFLDDNKTFQDGFKVYLPLIMR